MGIDYDLKLILGQQPSKPKSPSPISLPLCELFIVVIAPFTYMECGIAQHRNEIPIYPIFYPLKGDHIE